MNQEAVPKGRWISFPFPPAVHGWGRRTGKECVRDFPSANRDGSDRKNSGAQPRGIPGTRFLRESEEKCPANPRSRRGWWFRKDRHWDYERRGLVSHHQHWSGNVCHWCVSHRFCRKEVCVFFWWAFWAFWSFCVSVKPRNIAEDSFLIQTTRPQKKIPEK